MQAAEAISVPIAPNRDEAISALFVAEAARLIALGQLLTGDRGVAEDLVQDAFVTLYRRWPWLHDKDSAKAHLTAAGGDGSPPSPPRGGSPRKTPPPGGEGR